MPSFIILRIVAFNTLVVSARISSLVLDSVSISHNCERVDPTLIFFGIYPHSPRICAERRIQDIVILLSRQDLQRLYTRAYVFIIG